MSYWKLIIFIAESAPLYSFFFETSLIILNRSIKKFVCQKAENYKNNQPTKFMWRLEGPFENGQICYPLNVMLEIWLFLLLKVLLCIHFSLK